MEARTFVFGDIHGDLEGVEIIFELLPDLTSSDTLVFLGDYIDCGPNSKGIIEFLMELPGKTPAKVVCLKGNHEDGWLRAVGGNWPEFIMPPGNGCVQTMESFLDRPISPLGSGFNEEDFEILFSGSFFPKEVLEWMDGLPLWYEDDHGIYVHAGLPEDGGRFLHPSECEGTKKTALMWTRDKKFFRNYDGKLVVFGHTATKDLPKEMSGHTPQDDVDLWSGPSAIGLDTRAGKGGFLTCVELPDRTIYEARD